MTHALHDPIRHNAWATTQILEFCRGLDAPTLAATVPGTYGPILGTMRHIIDCEMVDLYRLLGQEAALPWEPGPPVALDVLRERAARLAATWETFLASEVDGERPLPADEGDGTIPAGIFLAVILYHGNEHRGQVCTILSALGHAPPDLTPWAYAFTTGRLRE
jgi:uncharacterized damage-inducible protein DinB